MNTPVASMVQMNKDINTPVASMGQRNTPCTQQMLDLQLGQSINFRPDQCILSGNVDDYANRSMNPGLSTSGNTAELGLLLREYPDRTTYYGNQHNNYQNFHAVPNFGLDAAAPSNFYAPCVLPPSSGRNFLPAGNNVHLPSAICMDEVNRNDQFVDTIRGLSKRKNTEVPPGHQYDVNGSSSSPFLFLNCEVPHWEQSYEPGVNLGDSVNLEHPEYLETSVIQPAERSHRSVRSRSGPMSVQSEPAYYPHPNYVLQPTHVGQPSNHAGHVWFGTENNIADGGCSNWNYNHPVAYMHGRCLHSGAFELSNMPVQAFPDASSSTSSPPVIFNLTLPNVHQHLSPVPTMQLQSYGHQIQMPAPFYHHPPHNLHPIAVNPTSRSLHAGPRHPPFSPNAEQTFRPRLVHHTVLNHGTVGIVSSEGAAVIDNPGFQRVGNVVDQHQDMRLDIDEMSYEELLALEEQIGDVKTGLTEDFIMKKLQTSVHNSQATSLQQDKMSRFSQEAEPCIICQVEFEEDEIIGALDCGHKFHAGCIKQWLLVKNLCPICKKTGLALDKSEG